MEKLKYFVLGVLAIIASYFGYNQLGQSYIPAIEYIMGSPINLESVPSTAVYANSTTTGVNQIDGGHLVQQFINTDGIESGLLCYQAKGTSSTSTLAIIQMGSYDGTNFYNIGTSTDLFSVTSTLNDLPKVVEFTPGAATSTGKCVPVDVNGYKYTRFIPYVKDYVAEVFENVQAYVYFVKLDEVTR